FLDEPTASLDPQARRNLWDVLLGIKERGKTIVYTTHYIEEAERLCDRIAILDHGRVVAMDTPEALVGGLGAAMSMELPEGVLSVDELLSLPGVDDARTEGDRVCITASDCNSVMSDITARGSAGRPPTRCARW